MHQEVFRIPVIATALTVSWAAGVFGVGATWVVCVSLFIITLTSLSSGFLPTSALTSRNSVFDRLLAAVVSVFGCQTCFVNASTSSRPIRENLRNYHKFMTSSRRLRHDSLPSWVIYPDTERVEWVNKVIAHVWPYVAGYVEKTTKPLLEKQLNSSMPDMAKAFVSFDLSLGKSPPRLGGIKAYTDTIHREELILDLDVMISTGAEVSMSLIGLTAAISNLQIYGTLRVSCSLVGHLPIFGHLKLCFLNPPNVHVDFAGSLGFLSFFPFWQLIKLTLERHVFDKLVVAPRSYDIQLTSSDNTIRYSRHLNQLPTGVLHLHVVEAKNLMPADVGLFNRKQSDPYCKIYVGDKVFKTDVVESTTTPVWNHYVEVIIRSSDHKSIQLEVKDRDATVDDHLGVANVDVELIRRSGYFEQWLTLTGTTSGSVRVRAWWLNVIDDVTRLRQVQQVASAYRKPVYDNDDKMRSLSTAVVSVTIDSAKNLPTLSMKRADEPSPWARIAVGNVEEKTSIKRNTNSPIWNETYDFLVQNVETETLELEIYDAGNGTEQNRGTYCCLGKLRIPITRLTQMKTLTSTTTTPDLHDSYETKTSTEALVQLEPFALAKSGPGSSVTLRLNLGVLSTSQGEHPMNSREVINPIIGRSRDVVTPQLEGNQKPSTNSESSDKTDIDGEIVDSSVNCGINCDDSQPNDPVFRRSVSAVDECSQVKQPQMNSSGVIQLSVDYVIERSLLAVVVRRCNGHWTKRRSLLRLSGLFVRMTLFTDQPLNSRSRQKTRTAKNIYDPEFNESLCWPLLQTELASSFLTVDVFGVVASMSLRRLVTRRLMLGSTDVQLSQFAGRQSAYIGWYNLHQRNNGIKTRSRRASTSDSSSLSS